MLDDLKQEANTTRTENGAAAYTTTMSDCLDLFSTIGALRAAPAAEIEGRFTRAFAENPDLAMKIAFFARDVRGGLGERRAFRVILKTLAALSPASVVKNLDAIPECGRYDDLLTLLDTPCQDAMLAYIRTMLARDRAALETGEGEVSLLAKWLPSVNASHPGTVRSAKRVARALGMNDAQYRKTLSALRARIAILENSLRERAYTFDYAKQPSKAMFRYRKAFLRNDGPRYRAYLAQVAPAKPRCIPARSILTSWWPRCWTAFPPRASGARWTPLGRPCPTIPAARTPWWWWTAPALCIGAPRSPGPLRWPCLWASISPSATKGRSGGTSSPFPAGPG